MKAGDRLVAVDHLEKLLLPRGASDCGGQPLGIAPGGAAPRLTRRFIHGRHPDRTA
jgi:hypothetical protein